MKRRLITLFSIAFIAIVAFGQEQSPSPQNNDQEKVGVNVNWVRTDILITERNGKPVLGLKKEDFLVSDNEKPQEILQLDSGPLPLSIFLVFDQSGSTKLFLKQQKKIFRDFLSLLSQNDELAVVGFDTDARIFCPLSSDLSCEKNLFSNLENTGGGTNLQAGLDAGIEILKRVPNSRRKVVIFISDDEQSPSLDIDNNYLIKRATKNSIAIFNVLIGENSSPSSFSAKGPGRIFLEQITAVSGGAIIRAQDGTRPTKELALIINQLKHTYSIFYKPTGEKTGELHKVVIELKDNPRPAPFFRKKYKVFARKEYYF